MTPARTRGRTRKDRMTGAGVRGERRFPPRLTMLIREAVCQCWARRLTASRRSVYIGERMQTLKPFSLIEQPDPAQTARDLSQQIRDQIRAAQEEARAAQKSQLTPPNPIAVTTPVVQIP